MNSPLPGARAWENASERQRRNAIIMLVIAAAVVPYLNALWNGFAFDDTFIIQTNARVHNLRAWRDIWLTPYWPALGRELGLYRPLTIFLFAIQWAAGHGARWVFHGVNIALHATASVLVLLLLVRLGAARAAALLGALVFAVHPVHTEAVANMVGQAELTATCFVLAACLIYAGREDGVTLDWKRRAWIIALYAIALLAKESAVVLPGLLVLIDFVQRRVALSKRGALEYLGAVAFPILGLVTVLLIYLSIRYHALGGTLTGVDAGPAFPYLKEHHVLNAFRAFPEYLRVLFWPADLTVDYVPATVFFVTSFTMMTVIGLLLMAGMTALMITVPWLPVIGAAPAWFLISISPVSNFFFPIGVLVAERTLYLPSVALSILVAFVATHFIRVAEAAPAPADRGEIRTSHTNELRVGALLLGCAILAMAVRTWIRNPDWKNSTTVQQAVFRDHPESYHAQWGRALVSWDNGKLDEAGKWFELTKRTYPRDSGMLATYGAFLMSVGEDDKALPLVRQSHDMHPFMPNSTALLAFLFITTRQPDSALAMIAKGERLELPLAMTLPMRAYVYQSQGRIEMAVAAWKQVTTRMTSGNAIAYAYLARALAYAGRQDEARDAIRKGTAATRDSVFKATLAAVDTAVTAGCYRAEDAPKIGDLYGPPNRPACDPLGSWFDRATLLQGATFSQFAIPRRIITSVRARTKIDKSLPEKTLQ
jgi:tetratricopeptide (TPR) repeat protein